MDVGVEVMHNAAEWEGAMLLRTGGRGEGVKPNFGQSVAVFTVEVLELYEYFAFSFKVHKASSFFLSFLFFSFFLFSASYEKSGYLYK